jgi:Phage P2 GpE.
MADVAVIFHWPPSEMAAFSLSELMKWRDRAIARVPKNE